MIRVPRTLETSAWALMLAAPFVAAPFAGAQVSLSTAVDLALHTSPKVHLAQAEVDKAQASLDQARDAYVPAINAGAGIGQSYGYSFNPPTLFTFNAQSLVFNFSQRNFIRSGRFGLSAADLLLTDAREGVEEDTAVTFLALQHDQQREGVLAQQTELAGRLVSILEDRLAAGQDTPIDLTTGKLTAANYKLAHLRAEDDTARDRTHLAVLMGLDPATKVRADGTIPDPAAPLAAPPATTLAMNPAVAAAFAQADARQQVARGDSRYLYRPQLSLVIQYNRYATFTDSFKQLQGINNTKIGANEGAFAVQIQLPLFDREHQAKARESLADANHARAQAEDAQQSAVLGQLKLRHSLAVLNAQAEVAELDQQLAQQQLDIVRAQLDASSTQGPLLTPKDEQNSRLAEREKFLGLIDARYQLRQAQINLLRQSGQIESWLHQAALGTP